MKYGVERQAKQNISIGFLAGSLFANYSSGIWKGIVSAVRDDGIGLFCFAGGSLNDPYGDFKERNTIYDLVKSSKIDGIIALSGVLANFIGKEGFKDYIEGLRSIPLVSIGIPFDDIPSVTVDNAQGLRESLVHLIRVHGAKKIAFVRGPNMNPEAEQRYLAFCDVLREHNFNFDPLLVTPGDFTGSTGSSAVSILIDERKVKFDAIIAANDIMAISAMKGLMERGIRVPEDVMVIGFDDIEDCSFITPPLTTVQQPLHRLGYEAVKECISFIVGEKNPGKIVLPTRLVIRRSCGCVGEQRADLSFPAGGNDETRADAHSPKTEKVLVSVLTSEMESQFAGFNDAITLFNWSKNLVGKLAADLDGAKEFAALYELEKTVIEATEKSVDPIKWQPVVSALYRSMHRSFPDKTESIDHLWKQSLAIIGEVVHRTNSYERYCTEKESQELCFLSQDLSTAFKIDSLIDVLQKKLHELGIASYYVSLYDDPKRTYSRLITATSAGNRILKSEKGIRFESSELCPDSFTLPRTRNGYILLPLYFKNIQLGFVIFETGPLNGIIYQTLAIQISSALKGAELLGKVEKQADSLQAEVIERISELHRSNKLLQEEINERKKIEELLSHEKERALITLESIADGVITTNTQGIITYLNPIAEKLTGFSVSEAKGLSLKRVLNVIYSTGPKDGGPENPTEIALGQNRSMKLSGTIILKSRDGNAYAIQESIAPIRDYENRTIGAVIVIHNVSETQKMSREIMYHSSHDGLTGLINRSKFEELLADHIESAGNDNREHTMCFIDIDKFRVVNDSCGSIAGDELLRHVGSILKSGIRGSDILARISGDQFGALFSSCPLERALLIADELCRLVARSTFQWEGRTHKVEISIGIVPIKSHTVDTAMVLSTANMACIFAKKKGGNRFFVYQQDDAELAQYHREMYFLSDISKAIVEDRFCLYSQVIRPIGNTVSKGEHYEILIRMIDEKGQILAPEMFISTAERYNIMPTIDRWAIHRLFSTYKIDYNETLQYSLAKYSINLSGASLSDDKFLDFVFGEFNEFGIPPFTICFEITETAAISNFSRVVTFIKELKKIGCCFSLDDFGTGWASFNYLKLLPVDYLKIDGSFVRGIVDNPLDFVLVQTINHIGHVMGLETIAEYVEDESIIEKLVDIGVNYAQGFAIERPKPLVI
jgi:diguanylate cyclase (GGDEF)-like protein/PAS domain S-box-containing protein